jgi:hypothetical protein
MEFISSIFTSPLSKERDQLEDKIEKFKEIINKMKGW